MKRTVILFSLLSLWSLVPLQNAVGGPDITYDEEDGVCVTSEVGVGGCTGTVDNPVECPPFMVTAEEFIYEAQQLCATQANALSIAVNHAPTHIRVTEDSEGTSVDGTYSGVPDIQEDTLVTVTEPVEGDDPVAIEATFPPGSLYLNSPGLESYEPLLPVGILVLPDPESAAFTGISMVDPELWETTLRTVTTRMERVSGQSRCYQKDPDGNPNSNTGEQMNACSHLYKPTQSDSSPNWNTRAVWMEGSARGGTCCKLSLARLKVRVGSSPASADMVRWSPTGSRSVGSPTQVTTTLGVSFAGVSGSISNTHTIYPASFGPHSINQNEGDEYFRWGWTGEKYCCQWVGLSGGIQIDYKAAEGFNYETGIQLDNYN